MIDLHSHVLPGLDDGAANLDEALAICEAAAADGIEVIAATPHVRRHDYATSPTQMEEALSALLAARPPVEVVRGGELDLAELERPADELTRFGLGGTRFLLVETPYVGWPLDLADRLFRVRLRGFHVILAHPERNPDVQERPRLLGPLVENGVLVQLTAASVDGRLGKAPGRCARTLVDEHLAHIVASDAHTPDVRAVGLSAAVAELGDPALARWLTEEVPRAVLADAETPTRPGSRPRRRWFG